jgi:hypothetical protein
MGRLAGALTVLVLCSGWRPSPHASPIPVVRSHAKGPRRCAPELPESSIARLRRRECSAPVRDPLTDPRVPERAAAPGPLAFASERVRDRVAHALSRPRYLQAHLPRDAQNAVAPPLA